VGKFWKKVLDTHQFKKEWRDGEKKRGRRKNGVGVNTERKGIGRKR
jgi:hypothetical protein